MLWCLEWMVNECLVVDARDVFQGIAPVFSGNPEENYERRQDSG
jgi:hypothetical protein